MTVQGEAPAADVDRQAVDQQFAEIYAEHYERLRRRLYYRNDLTLADLAEDFAQEAFIRLYQSMLKGKTAEKPYVLVCVIANRVVLQHLELKKNTARTTDFSDPASTPIIAKGHAYAPATPELAHVSAELDQAINDMEAASAEWRSKNKAWATQRSLLVATEAWDGLAHETAWSGADALRKADQAEATALEAFRRSCYRVGQLRAELENVGGGNWKSSSGIPVSPGTRPRVQGSLSDPTVTHCPDGHLLDRANTYFSPDGRRYCRTCRAAWAQQQNEKRRKGTSTRSRGGVIPVDVLEQARQALASPEYLSRPVPDIAKTFGISKAGLYTNLPVTELRREAKAKAAELAAAR